MSITVNGTTGLNFPDGTSQPTAGFAPFRNRIINGDMRIDQRNAGAAVTVNTGGIFMAADRFRLSSVASSGVFTGQQISDAPSGFKNSLRVTVTTADASLAADDAYYCAQQIEGHNVTDLNFGSASAQPITLSFWVKSSLTGTFGGAFCNNTPNRSYPFNYTISAANTWEYKTITVAGDTSGTWLTDNNIGLRVYWGLGVGSNFVGTANQWVGAFDISATSSVNLMATNGATWQITGVQVEKGSAATSFEYRPIGTELAMCQRYYYQMSGYVGTGFFRANTSTAEATILHPVPMRASPSVTSDANAVNIYSTSGAPLSNAFTYGGGSTTSSWLNYTTSLAVSTHGTGAIFYAASGKTVTISAEL